MIISGHNHSIFYVFASVFLTALVVLYPLCVHSQTDAFTFNRLSTESGLSQSIVHAIHQDKTGFMWFGTQDGLNRYDGHHVKVFKHKVNKPATLSSNFVRTIHEDRNGFLWVGTENGYNRYDPSSESFKRYYFSSDSTSIDVIHYAFQDKKNRLWVTIRNKGLYCLESLSDSIIITPFYFNSQLEQTDILVLAEDNNGTLYIKEVTESDILYSYNPKTKNLKKLFEHLSFFNILADDNSNLWITGIFHTSSGNKYEWESILKYDLNSNESTFYSDPSITYERTTLSKNPPLLLWDEEGNIWKSGLGGLHLFDLGEEKFTKHVPIYGELNDIKTIFLDKDQIIWIGLEGNGVKWLPLWSTGNIEKITYQNGDLTFSSVRSIYEDQNDVVWIGGYDGLNKFNRKTQKSVSCEFKAKNNVSNQKAELLTNSAVYEIFPDIEESKQYLWILFEGFIFCKLNKSDLTLEKEYDLSEEIILGQIYDALVDDNQYWFVVPNALIRFDRQMKNKQSYPLKLPNIASEETITLKTITKIDNRFFYVGSNNGLFIFDAVKEIFLTRYSNNPDDSKSLSYNDINHILKDSKGHIWIATNGGGLNRFDPTLKTFEVFTLEDGLSNNVVYAILEDWEGKLWMSTNYGLSCFDPKTKDFQNFDISDGLQDHEFNWKAFTKSPSGRMYFGGIKGVNSFNPKEIGNNATPPKAILTHVKKMNENLSFDKPVNQLDKFEFSYNDRVISFEFAALNYHQSHKNQYTYKLENLHDEWLYNGNDNSITFSSLNPGSYTLQVKASNSDNIWSEEILALDIKIIPPWWLTWWAKMIAITAIFCILYSIYAIRVRLLKGQRKRLEEQVYNKTRDIEKQKEEIHSQAEELKLTNKHLKELDDFKQQMTNMIVHDLKNPLNSIINMDTDNMQKNDMVSVKNSGRTMLQMVMNILETQKLEEATTVLSINNHRLSELIHEATLQIEYLLEEKNQHLEIRIEQEVIINIDLDLIVRVVVNLLINAIKFSSLNATITLQSIWIEEGNLVKVEVIDHGVGIPEEEQENIFKKFKQVSPKSIGKIRSTGLGLTFSKLAIEAHQGAIGVDSIEGKGSTFWFTLPASIDPTRTEANIQQKQKRSEISFSNLIPDEKEYVVSIIKELKRFEVFQYSDIKEVIKKIKEHTINREILSWIDEIELATYACNQDLYTNLLKIKLNNEK